MLSKYKLAIKGEEMRLENWPDLPDVLAICSLQINTLMQNKLQLEKQVYDHNHQTKLLSVSNTTTHLRLL